MDPITFADHRCLLQFQCPAGYLVWLMPLVTITFYHCARSISHSSSTVKMQPVFAHCNKCEIWNNFSKIYYQSNFLTKFVYFVYSICSLQMNKCETDPCFLHTFQQMFISVFCKICDLNAERDFLFVFCNVYLLALDNTKR